MNLSYLLYFISSSHNRLLQDGDIGYKHYYKNYELMQVFTSIDKNDTVSIDDLQKYLSDPNITTKLAYILNQNLDFFLMWLIDLKKGIFIY